MRLLTGVAVAAVLLLATQLPSALAGARTSEQASDDRAAATAPVADVTSAVADIEPSMFDEVPATANRIATLREALTVFAERDGEKLTVLEPTTRFDAPRTLSVVSEHDDWLRVRLDERPNGSVGWVRTDEVDLTWTSLFVVIDLSERRLVLFDEGVPVETGIVAIGAERSVTPTGRTYVTDVVATPEATIYGPFALGLALYSDTETEFAGGNGQIAIHGTNQPHLLGEEVSRGCVRVDNDLVRRLAGRVPLGTPVVIVD